MLARKKEKTEDLFTYVTVNILGPVMPTMFLDGTL